MEENSDADKAAAMQNLVAGKLAASVSRLSGSSRTLPHGRDFHFYRNFQEFRNPIKELSETSTALLREIGASPLLWGGHPPASAFPSDPDDAYDWLVDVHDDVLERLAMSLDEFWRMKKNMGGMEREEFEGGFQTVYGKKKKKKEADTAGYLASGGDLEANKTKAPGGRTRMPFHVPSIPRSQDEFHIWVDNSNEPFNHVWLEKSEDGSRYIHPLEKYSPQDFVDRDVQAIKPILPLPLADTPFTLVEDVRLLKALAAKLHDASEFAVDLEHNQYRTFQGLTCLMQISTRSEDFVVDTLKLRDHIGPHLRDAFSDPSKRKVMHGADRDVLWLQRDFSIYVCNLFDTQQASRLLQLERNSLEHLLGHFCEVTANKEYQTADWRLRPLPDEMIKYAREDTHYLLYIYDLMRVRLTSTSNVGENKNDLLEVYIRSYDICMQLYEKELLTDASYLHIYGVQDADLDAKQLAVVSGLYEWRDKVARAEDESTGYVLPNKILLEIAREMPVTSRTLRRIIKSKHTLVEHNLGAVVQVIKSSMENAAAFESASEQLKNGRMEIVRQLNEETGVSNPESLDAPQDPTNLSLQTIRKGEPFSGQYSSEDRLPSDSKGLVSSFVATRDAGGINQVASQSPPEKVSNLHSGRLNESTESLPLLKHIDVASIPVLKKPSRSFGALLGNPLSKRKLGDDSKVHPAGQAHSVVEQIKSSVVLPFHKFAGENERITSAPESSMDEVEASPLHVEEPKIDNLADIIPLENSPELSSENSLADKETKHRGWFPPCMGKTESGRGKDEQIETADVSMSDLSSSFRKCFQSVTPEKLPNSQDERSPSASDDGLKFKPFDYAAARQRMQLINNNDAPSSEDKECRNGVKDFGNSKNKASQHVRRLAGEDGKRDNRAPRRRQAFPASGNRSATFR
ncbi:protein RRP6-like 1 [Nymphaea colorata]|nr:protein RRP6-like 1 [Nymphaea colorata]